MILGAISYRCDLAVVRELGYSKRTPNHHAFQDLSESRFGALTVKYFVGRHLKSSQWVCLCDCGTATIVPRTALIKGQTVSCGCSQEDGMRAARLSHGDTSGGETPEYNTWLHIKARCYTTTCQDFPAWGGSGVTVCDRWLNGDGEISGFECFLKDMGRRPGDGYSIDRHPDPDGNYEPSNCRWATSTQQNRNRRNSRVFEWGGKMLHYADICALVGADPDVVRWRLDRGWSLERAINEPKHWRGK